MYRIVPGSEIEKEKWNALILKSKYPKPYCLSWYLDFMAPGWSALIHKDYEIIMPLTGLTKYGISYLASPVFFQQLNIYTSQGRGIPDKHILDILINKYRLVDIRCGSRPQDERFKVSEKQNLILRLNRNYEDLSGGYQKACRKNIRQAGKFSTEFSKDCSAEEVIGLFRNNTGRKIGGIDRNDYKRLTGLMKYSIENNLAELRCVRSGNELIYAAFYFIIDNVITLFFTPTSRESHRQKTGYLFTDNLIREYSGRDYILDFSGSSIPSVARYMKSFGAIPETYYRIYLNRLPWPLRLLK